MEKNATYITSAKRPSYNLLYNLNFDIFLRTHTLKNIEYQINKINRTQGR